MTVVMYDTVTVETVPANPQAVAGYVAGNWPTYNGLVAKFPQAFHLSIAPQADHDADCLDVEPGDATNSQAPAWFKRQQARGLHRPVLYTSASNVAALLSVMSNAGVPRAEIRLWSAHYNFVPHICAPGGCGYPQADGTQWTDKALGRNLDASLLAGGFFTPPAPQHTPEIIWQAIAAVSIPGGQTWRARIGVNRTTGHWSAYRLAPDKTKPGDPDVGHWDVAGIAAVKA